MFMVKKSLIINIDSSSLRISGSVKSPDACSWRVSSPEDTNKYHLIYSSGVGASDMAVFVKILHIVTAVSRTAPSVVVLRNLSESELPSSTRSSGMHVVTLEGSCIGGTQQQSIQGTGFLVFMCGGVPGIGKLLYTWYYEKLLKPFIEWVRITVFGWVKGISVPSALRALLYLDGEMSASAVIMETLQANLAANLTHVNKNVQKTTAMAQAADVCSIFHDIKQLAKSLDVDDCTPLSDFKDLMERILKQDSMLQLNPCTLHALAKFLAAFPTIKAKSDMDATVSDGFAQTGMAGMDRFLDGDKLLCTCQRFLTIDKVTVHKIKSNMPLLLEEHSAHGCAHAKDRIA